MKLLSRVTLCDPRDCSLLGSSVHGIFQARVLEWVALSFSRGSSQPREWTPVSCISGRHFTIWPPGKPLVRIVLRRNMDNIKGNWTVWLPGACLPLSATSNCEGEWHTGHFMIVNILCFVHEMSLCYSILVDLGVSQWADQFLPLKLWTLLCIHLGMNLLQDSCFWVYEISLALGQYPHPQHMS